MPGSRAARLLLLTLAGCSLRSYEFAASDADETTSDATTAVPSGSSGTTQATTTTGAANTTTGSASTSGPPDTTAGFIPIPDVQNPEECSIFEQDCPAGQKCMPYSNDGGNAWNATKCVPIVPNPAGLYEPCTVKGSGVSGEDTCDKHLMCWNVSQETGMGQCFGQCIGTPESPGCEDPTATCHWGRSALSICIPGCDPLLQDCLNADACIPQPMGDGFVCVLDASGDEGQLFDPCEFANACDPGFLCADPALAVECDPQAAGCCLNFCDLTAPKCMGKEQVCLAWYEAGMEPPGLENVGVCGLPQ